MAIEVYIPLEVAFQGQAVDDAAVLTLYDPDNDEPRGALTGPNPLPADSDGGPLEVRGTREGKTWSVTIGRLAVTNRSAMGCEFRIIGGVERKPTGKTPAKTER